MYKFRNVNVKLISDNKHVVSQSSVSEVYNKILRLITTVGGDSGCCCVGFITYSSVLPIEFILMHSKMKLYNFLISHQRAL